MGDSARLDPFCTWGCHWYLLVHAYAYKARRRGHHQWQARILSFHHAIEDIDRRLIYSELVNTGGIYTIDFEDFEKKVVDNDVKVFICAFNPVGRVWTEDELRRLLEICKNIM